jgi:hypothetical protein
LPEREAPGLPVPLRVLPSPYREAARPVLDRLRTIRRADPKPLFAVYLPEYVVDKWRENLIHNQAAVRIKTRLHFQPGVMVASVPRQLAPAGRTGGWCRGQSPERLFRRGDCPGHGRYPTIEEHRWGAVNAPEEESS